MNQPKNIFSKIHAIQIKNQAKEVAKFFDTILNEKNLDTELCDELGILLSSLKSAIDNDETINIGLLLEKTDHFMNKKGCEIKERLEDQLLQVNL